MYIKYNSFEEFKSHKDVYRKAVEKYHNMKQRCYKPNHKDYKYYGAVGITICDEWLKNSEEFYKWLYKNKYYTSEDKVSIDRIDSTKGYSPSNCRLTSISFNTRYIKGLVRNPQKYSNTRLYFEAGRAIPFETIKSRNRANWSKEDIINKPIQHHKVSIKMLKQALNNNYNKRSFLSYLIQFRNNLSQDFKMYGDKSIKYNLYRQAIEIIREYKKQNHLKEAKTDYIERRNYE